MIDNNKIFHILDSILDPHSGRSILKAKMVHNLKIQDNNVYFDLSIPKTDNNIRESIHFACIQSIQQEYPKAEVHINSMHANIENVKTNNLPQVKNIIAVASGKGGVGKSTISVNMAIAMAHKGYKVGLMDADLYGPSIPTMMGLQGKRPRVENLYGKHKIVPLTAFGVEVISIGFIVEPEQAVVLRGPRLGGIIKQFINECLWSELDYLIIDLPPGTGDIQLTLVQTIGVTGSVIVTTPQEVAVVDAVKAMNMFFLENINVPILGVVENMSWFTPKELPNNKYLLFGKGGGEKLAKLGNTLLLGQIPLVQGIREGGDSGTPVVAQEKSIQSDIFLSIVSKLIDQVDQRNNNIPPTKKVTMVR